MNHFLKLSLFTAFVTTMVGCNNTSPQKYVEIAVLNTNLVTAYYRPPYFEEMMSHQGNAVDYVRQQTIPSLEQAIEKVKNLRVTDETKGLIDASLDFLVYGKELFETEYIDIAQMVDDNEPQAAIDTAITRVFDQHDPFLVEKLDRLEAVAIPFAEKHGVDLTFN